MHMHTDTHAYTTIQPRVQLAECDETIETEETEIFITNTHRKKIKCEREATNKKLLFEILEIVKQKRAQIAQYTG